MQNHNGKIYTSKKTLKYICKIVMVKYSVKEYKIIKYSKMIYEI